MHMQTPLAGLPERVYGGSVCTSGNRPDLVGTQHFNLSALAIVRVF